MQRVIPDPGFAGDDGGADPRVGAALAAFAADPARYAEALAAVQDSRLLVPVVAVLGETAATEDGLVHEKTSDMATVLTTGRDGRTALLAFTSVSALASWNADARPVPVPAGQAAASALQDGAEAMVIDVAGPVLLAIETEDLRSLAAGHRLVPVEDGWGWIRPM